MGFLEDWNKFEDCRQMDYNFLLNKKDIFLPPIDHPTNTEKLIVTGSELTHLGCILTSKQEELYYDAAKKGGKPYEGKPNKQMRS